MISIKNNIIYFFNEFIYSFFTIWIIFKIFKNFINNKEGINYFIKEINNNNNKIFYY